MNAREKVLSYFYKAGKSIEETNSNKDIINTLSDPWNDIGNLRMETFWYGRCLGFLVINSEHEWLVECLFPANAPLNDMLAAMIEIREQFNESPPQKGHVMRCDLFPV